MLQLPQVRSVVQFESGSKLWSLEARYFPKAEPRLEIMVHRLHKTLEHGSWKDRAQRLDSGTNGLVKGALEHKREKTMHIPPNEYPIFINNLA